jgi:preprotein translocase subunit YajC
MIVQTLVILAQTPAPTAAQKPPIDPGMNMMVWMVFAFVLIYFLTIRPQRRKQMDLERQIKALKTGDRVVTSGGLHGVIANIKDGPSLSLKIADGVKVEVEKAAIASVLQDKPAAAKS